MKNWWACAACAALWVSGCATGSRDRSVDAARDMTMPDGGGTVEDGAVVMDDGAVVMDDGAVIMDDGSTNPDGGTPMGDGGTETCMDACTMGATRCAGTQVQTCVMDPVIRCTVWGAASDCAAGLVCSADECRSSCMNACSAGATRCSSDVGTQTCALQTSGCTDWNAEMACPGGQVCMGDACMACTDGARRCSATGVEQCTSGRWTAIESCAFGCRDAGCTTVIACTPGAYRCNGSGVETCNSTGTAWLHVATCTVGCAGGLCTGGCTAGETRCNGSAVETCNASGTAWTMTSSCASTFCSRGACALAGLDVGSSRELAGDIVVDGPVIVRSGATVTVTGPLTIRADSIVVEAGGSISAVPYGTSPLGAGADGTCGTYCAGGSGGGYGVLGTRSYNRAGGPSWGSANDSDVQPGSRGGNGYGTGTSSGAGGLGGGVIRLISPSIHVLGQVTADGGPGTNTGAGVSYAGGGGSGGGILFAADELRITGSVSARGGAGGTGGTFSYGGAGGDGRVKILHGAMLEETGTISGTVTRGLLPPLELASSTHPDPNLFYNDDFETVAMSWSRPYSPITGYYWLTHSAERVPAPGNATLATSELVAVPYAQLGTGTNLFQIVSVNPMITVGRVYTPFRIQVNRTPPAVTSSSHPNQTTWYANRDVYAAWNTPNGASNYQGIYYAFDHYGDTMPGPGSTFIPISQLQLLRDNTQDGVWALHVVSVDTQGRRTREASHYRVRIGTDPGAGNVLGQIIAQGGNPISGARVSVNRELFPGQATNASGNYNIGSVPVGTWELHVSAPGYRSEMRPFTISAAAGSTSVNVTLMPE